MPALRGWGEESLRRKHALLIVGEYQRLLSTHIYDALQMSLQWCPQVSANSCFIFIYGVLPGPSRGMRDLSVAAHGI